MSHSYPSDISREQFARILPTLESARRRTKPRTVDLSAHSGYDVFCGVLYLLKSGCQWRMLPPRTSPNWPGILRSDSSPPSPPWRTCYPHRVFPAMERAAWPARSGFHSGASPKKTKRDRLARPAQQSNGRKEQTSF